MRPHVDVITVIGPSTETLVSPAFLRRLAAQLGYAALTEAVRDNSELVRLTRDEERGFRAAARRLARRRIGSCSAMS